MKPSLDWHGTWMWVAITAILFHAGWLVPRGEALLGGAAYGLVVLTRQRDRLRAMNVGWGLGLILYGPHLHFFWTLFGVGAVALWLVLGFWLGIFLALIRFTRERWGERWAAIAIPVFWTGLEYFRSELYALRFSWMSFGHGIAWAPGWSVWGSVGTYGVGFGMFAVASFVAEMQLRARVMAGMAALVVGSFALQMPRQSWDATREKFGDDRRRLRIAGVQVEFPDESVIPRELDRALAKFPDADLFILPEYTLQGPPPEALRRWCRERRRHLLVGGKALGEGETFYNTAFVVGPDGDVVFQQAKMRPIQFMKDGLPAPSQRIWESPWGMLGICICYDLSYTRVLDGLARLGAEALLVPTMDVVEWGEYQHRLHARLGPVRACEYGVPVIRVASSGISQVVTREGRVLGEAGFGHDGGVLGGEVELGVGAKRPWDRWMVWPCVWATGGVASLAFWRALTERRKQSTTGAPVGGEQPTLEP